MENLSKKLSPILNFLLGLGLILIMVLSTSGCAPRKYTQSYNKSMSDYHRTMDCIYGSGSCYKEDKVKTIIDNSKVSS